MAPATTDANNIMPRVAALPDVMDLSDVTGVIDEATSERPIYAGNAVQTVWSNDAKMVVTFRTSWFDAPATGGIAPIDADKDPDLSAWIEDEVAAPDRPDPTSAGVVVSDGRGVGSEDEFKIIEALADKLNAAVGASRAVVDSWYAPND